MPNFLSTLRVPTFASTPSQLFGQEKLTLNYFFYEEVAAQRKKESGRFCTGRQISCGAGKKEFRPLFLFLFAEFWNLIKWPLKRRSRKPRRKGIASIFVLGITGGQEGEIFNPLTPPQVTKKKT